MKPAHSARRSELNSTRGVAVRQARRMVSMNDAWPVPPFVGYIIGYVFVLIAALVVVNVVLHRVTRRERGPRRRPPGS
jgi:hypothetical protein